MSIIVLGLIGGGLVVLAVVFYLFSVASRRTFACPQCGEKMTTDYLDARRCGMCGAPLEREGYR